MYLFYLKRSISGNSSGLDRLIDLSSYSKGSLSSTDRLFLVLKLVRTAFNLFL